MKYSRFCVPATRSSLLLPRVFSFLAAATQTHKTIQDETGQDKDQAIPGHEMKKKEHNLLLLLAVAVAVFFFFHFRFAYASRLLCFYLLGDFRLLASLQLMPHSFGLRVNGKP
jgi:hypothetical protein